MRNTAKWTALALLMVFVCSEAPAQMKVMKKKKATVGVSKSSGGWVRVVSPNGQEEVVAGTELNIQWQSENRGGKVRIMLMVENPLTASLSYAVQNPGLTPGGGVAAIKLPLVLVQDVSDTGSFKYRVPYTFNSRLGYRFKVVIQKGDQKDESDQHFMIYPEVDLAPINIKIRNKKKSRWGLAALTSIIAGGAGNLPFGTEAKLIKEAVHWGKKDNKAISRKKDIVVEFDVISRGIKILNQSLMTKLAVRLQPGGAELNAGGFSHAKIVPGRKYHYKATIKPKSWDIAAGTYRLEIFVDPQNNANEPEVLRENNKKTIRFRVK